MSGARGQATVELGLSMLAFITVLVFGIHFAEVGYLSMRAQQASAYALYEVTGERAHEKGSDLSRASTVAGLATIHARDRWLDFQPNVDDSAHAASITHVFTEIRGMTVRCTNEQSLSYDTSVPLGGLLAPNPFDGSRGGVKCMSSATIALAPGFPTGFHDGEWNLDSPHYAGSRTSYTVCGTPRATGGQCGQFGVLVGDFSLQGPAESRSVDLQNGGNDAYYDLVHSAMGITACPSSMALSAAVTWTPVGLDACSFSMSYQGVEANYRQNIGGVHSGSSTWLTGGTNSRREIRDPETYLGVKRFP